MIEVASNISNIYVVLILHARLIMLYQNCVLGGLQFYMTIANQEVEASTGQPAGQRDTTAAMVVVIVMATGNAVPPPSRNLATMITTMPANTNDHAAGDAVVGADGIVND